MTMSVIRRVVSTATGDETSRTTTAFDGCRLFPIRTGVEGSTFDSDTVSVDAVAVFPTGSDVLVTDWVEVGSAQYVVANSPYELASPFTGTDRGLAVPIREWKG